MASHDGWSVVDGDTLEGDRMGTVRFGRMNTDFDEPPDACNCDGPCGCRAPNPFVASLKAGRAPVKGYA